MKKAVSLILHTALVALVAACQTEPPSMADSPTSPSVTASTPATEQSQQKPGVYESDRFGFRFAYPATQFVVDDTFEMPNSEEFGAIANIQVWTKEHSEKIKAGDYDKGTEYPANVSVSVHPNPQKLALLDWAEQSNWFTDIQEVGNLTVADEEAISFQSEGLYENHYIAFNTPDGDQIILLSRGATNFDNGNDQKYLEAFDAIARTFTFN